ncbi:formylmethanofuran dehydrogenase subunit C [Pelomonas sp. KK5]|uniref:formylmethanofuran dehydrogenase subunit C n=1 Tax=Pelomonas sp. KK5 TaxID=1855730 RepID=UPI00097BED8B|nr:formylmethanofuran dehydrogenase subunit C [Pelomonas sp. KK5]
MSGWRLTLRQAPPLRLDLRALQPREGITAAELEQLPLGHGRELLPLAEFFTIAPAAEWVLEGEGLARCDRIGWQMAGGTLRVAGSAGHHAGTGMSGGQLLIEGDAGVHAGCEMSGGMLDIGGDVDEFAAGALPGSMDGMRGGTLIVRGNAGPRFGDRMRRGTALVLGDAGDFLASRMVAGTIAVAGRIGAHPAYGMRRGSLVLRQSPPALPATFVPAGAEAAVFWQLLARELARLDESFADLPGRAIERHLGDLAADGRGELILLLPR